MVTMKSVEKCEGCILMNDSIYIDDKTGEIMINPNVDTIYLPPDIYDGLREIISDEIDKEILNSLVA